VDQQRFRGVPKTPTLGEDPWKEKLLSCFSVKVFLIHHQKRKGNPLSTSSESLSFRQQDFSPLEPQILPTNLLKPAFSMTTNSEPRALPSSVTDAVLVPSNEMPEGSQKVEELDFNKFAGRDITVDDLISGMNNMGFQASSIGEAVRIINDMVLFLFHGPLLALLSYSHLPSHPLTPIQRPLHKNNNLPRLH
jgi:hypothetical protein